MVSRTMPLYHFAPTAVGFYMFIAHRVLANHGLFGEQFGHGYEEENDLVMRAGKVGTRAIIVNHAFAYHAGSASFVLRDADLTPVRHQNLKTLSETHQEFLPLVRRYEGSAHYEAERLMSGLLPDAVGRIKVVFDLSEMGQHYNGTNEQAVAVLRSIAERHSDRIRLSALGTAESFRCHGLDRIDGLSREDPAAPGLHAIAIRLAQPFELHHLSRLETSAPINVFAMLDTIAEDCGPLAVTGMLEELWGHVSEHATGLIYISRCSEQAFMNRHPAARSRRSWTALLPTRRSAYGMQSGDSERRHIFVLGNHFAHKGSENAAKVLATAFPDHQVIALGANAVQLGNLTVYRAGGIDPQSVQRLFGEARIVVMPSYVEGFGLGFMHALAAGRPIVARRISATEEIVETLDDVRGIFLFDDDATLEAACASALNCDFSHADDRRGISWHEWADGLITFCMSLVERPDLFQSLVRRLASAQKLRQALVGSGRLAQDGAVHGAAPPSKLSNAKAVDLEVLLEMDGETFVEHAYATVLRRQVDQGGLRSYLNQLASGAHKVDVLLSLSSSPEGRMRDAKLRGLDELAAKVRRERLPLIKRIFGS
jgi:hypothetical protein